MAPENGADVGAARQYACTVCRVLYRSDFTRCPRDGGEVVAIDAGDDPLLGATLAGRYVIEELIGEGGMGRVYRARHAELPRRFAIKILFGELAALSEMRARFRMEAEAAARLDHPNVVSVVDVGESDEGLLYLAMEYVAGRSLGAILDQEGPLESVRATGLARRLCRGLQHAHDHGMVHRDFKPDNVIVSVEDGVEIPRIADFGLAVLSEEAGGGSRLTRKGETMGTPPYMSPEQLTGRQVDARSDLFSLGVVLYEMLTGKTPFEGSVFELVRQVATEPPPPMSVRAPEVSVPAQLERIAIKLLSIRPADRYPTANQVIVDLEAMSSSAGFQARSRRTSAAHALPAPVPAVDDVEVAPTLVASPPPSPRSAMTDTGEILAMVKRRRRPMVAVALIGAGLAIAGIVVTLAVRGGDDGSDGDTKTALADTTAADTPEPPAASLPPPTTPEPVAVADAAVEPPASAEPAAIAPDAAPAPSADPPATAPARSSKSKPTARSSRSEKSKPAKPAAPSQSADELYREGTSLYLKGHLAEAKKKYESALSVNSRYPAAHRGLGFCYQRLGDQARALKHLKRYLDLSPKARDAGEVKKRIEALGG